MRVEAAGRVLRPKLENWGLRPANVVRSQTSGAKPATGWQIEQRRRRTRDLLQRFTATVGAGNRPYQPSRVMMKWVVENRVNAAHLNDLTRVHDTH